MNYESQTHVNSPQFPKRRIGLSFISSVSLRVVGGNVNINSAALHHFRNISTALFRQSSRHWKSKSLENFSQEKKLLGSKMHGFCSVPSHFLTGHIFSSKKILRGRTTLMKHSGAFIDYYQETKLREISSKSLNWPARFSVLRLKN